MESMKKSEQIGKAEVTRKGFRVRIFNGDGVYYIKSVNHHQSFRVFKRLGDKVIQEIGQARYVDRLKTLIAFDLGNCSLAYINLNTSHSNIRISNEGGAR